MAKQLKENMSWLGVVLTILIGMFPQIFVTIGFIIANNWLHISTTIIIILLISIYRKVHSKKDGT